MTEKPVPRDGQSDPYAPPSGGAPTSDRPGQPQQPDYGQPPSYGSAPTYPAAPSYGPATDYGQAPGGPPPYGYDPASGYPPAGYDRSDYEPTRGYAPGSELAPKDERTWGLLPHVLVAVSGIVSMFTLGWLGPLLIMLIQGPKSPFVRHHAVEALNFFISLTIYALISLILIPLVIGFPMLAAVMVLGVGFPIYAAVKANAGEYYRYPLTIRLIK